MRIEQLTVRLRARSDWEAVELGMALVRRHAGAIWKPWWWLTLPVFALLNLGAWWIDQFWLAAALMWWLKPAFDRIPLYVISRAVFGSVPGTRETLRAQASWGVRPLPHLLTWRRLSPVRSLYLPIDLLEGVQGERLRQRRRILAGQAYGTAIMLTLVCLHFETALLLGGVAAVVMYLPQDLLPDSMQAAFGMLATEWPAWLKLGWNALAWAAISVVEPFYVGAGFGLYLNRRTQIEAWDLEIVFRTLRARLSAAAPLLLAVMLWTGTDGALAQERHGVRPTPPSAAPAPPRDAPTPPTLPIVFGDQRVDRLPHRDAPLGGQLRDALHGRVADAARRVVDDAFERLVVARVDHQPDIGQHVLDLLVVVERTALVDAVGNAAAAEVVLQHGRLVVGAVEDHRFRPVVAR